MDATGERVRLKSDSWTLHAFNVHILVERMVPWTSSTHLELVESEVADP